VDAVKVGERLRAARKARGITQSELSQLVDLTPKYISNLECGFKCPKLETFVAIANALNCDANTLLADVLDTATSENSSSISKRMARLSLADQRKLLRLFDIMIEEAENDS